MHKISKIIGRIVPNVRQNLNFWKAMFFMDWEDIVGHELSELMSVEKIVRSKDGILDLYVRVLSSASILIRYNENIIKEKIFRYTGNLKVDSLKIIQVGEINTKKMEKTTSPTAQKKNFINFECDIKNESLRAALKFLKMEIESNDAA